MAHTSRLVHFAEAVKRCRIYSAICCFLIFFCIALSGCKKDDGETFYRDISGTWVPYQVKYPDRTEQGNMRQNSIFGAYDESVMMNQDKTFVPGSFDNNIFAPDAQESGTYTYDALTKELEFKGPLVSTFEVIALNGNEMQLATFGFGEVVFYFRKK
jgi:hypothetical protein